MLVSGKTDGRRLRIAAVLVGLAALAVVLAWLLVPRVVRSQIEQQGSTMLGRGLHVEQVSFSPLSLTLELRGLALDASAADADRRPQARVERVEVNLSARSLFAGLPVVEALELDAPVLRLARTGPGRYDVDDLVARLSEPARPAEAAARFALYNLRVRGGRLDFDDRPEGRRHTLDMIEAGLPFVSNVPEQVELHVEPSLSLRLDGSPLKLAGRTRPFAPDRESALKLELPALALDGLWPYVPRSLPLRGQGGVLSGSIDLRFAQPPGRPAQLVVSGGVTLSSIALRRPDGAPLAAWKTLAVVVNELRPLEQLAALRSVTLESAVLDLRRDRAGRLELAALAGPASGPRGPAWRWSLGGAELRSSTLRWSDASLQPAAALEARELSARIGRLASAEPARTAPVSGSGVLASPGDRGAVLGRLKLDGQAGLAAATLGLEFDALQLAAGAPYLRTVLAETPVGRLSGRAEVDWAAGEPGRLALTLPRVALDDLRWGGQRLAALRLTGLRADLPGRRLAVDTLALDRPRLDLARDAAGHWNLLTMIRSASPAAQDGSGPAWQASLKALTVSGGSLHLADASTPAPVGFALQSLALKAAELQWPAGPRPAALDLSLDVVPDREPGTPAPTPGRLQAQGTLALQPLAWRGRVSAARLPLQVAEPYLREHLPVLLRRAELGWRGDTEFRLPDAGPALSLRGNAMLADLRVLARGDDDEAGDELLAWQSLRIESLAASMAPGQPTRLATGPVRLSRFFSRLVVTPEGRLNLRDVRGGDAPAPATPAVTPPSPAAPLELDIAGVDFVDGRVDFRDRFIQPNYSASLSELNGKLGRLRSGTREMATLEISGRAADTATLEVRGALNPTADPLALDIAAKASGLELAPLSPYAGKYAGYAIERGKLSMDVAYRVDADGRLEARNRIVLNQLTFGDPVDSPVATQLPVRLALALLADRHGVIDVDLPISGSINDPEFSVFGLVMKVIGNLLAKAVTSPFALLSGGGGDETGAVEFLPGTATLAPSSEAALDRFAQALKDRPALQTTVAGAADALAEHDAIQAAVLEDRLRSEQARERARSRGVGPGAAVPATEERERTLRRVYADTRLPNKPRNLVGLALDIPPAQMETLLKAAVTVDADVARDLALRRGVVVREALVARGLPAERLFLAAPRLDAADGQAGWTPKVELSLEMP